MPLPDPIARVFDLIGANPYFRPPWTPYAKQLLFLSLEDREVLYGGAAFGAKTVALLMRALLYAHVPGYAAAMFRRTHPELEEPGGFIELADLWLKDTDASWHGGKYRWTFPTGALPIAGGDGVASPNGRLQFKHIQHDKDADKLKLGATYQTMCWGELTTFTELQYRRPQARLRRPASGPLSKVPLAARSDTNPGGEGHEWVKDRFLDSPWYWSDRAGAWVERYFLPAWARDNPQGDVDEYMQSLEAALDPVELKRLQEGDWEVTEVGEIFDPGKLHIVQPDQVPAGLKWIRAWDTAGSVSETAAWTASFRMAWDAVKGRLWLDAGERFRLRPGDRDDRMLAVAHSDNDAVGACGVLIEKGTSDAGLKQEEDHLRIFAGFNIQCIGPKGDKVLRAMPLARQWNKGNVYCVSGPWVGPLKTEAQLFSASAKFKDQIDALTLGFNNQAMTQASRLYASGRKKAAAKPGRRVARQSIRRVFP